MQKSPVLSPTLKTPIINPNSLATLTGHTSHVTALTVLPDGRLVSGSGDNTLRVWEGRGSAYACVATLTGHTHYVSALTVLPDGRLVSGSTDQTLRLWDVGCAPVLKNDAARAAVESRAERAPDSTLVVAARETTAVPGPIKAKVFKKETTSSTSEEDDTFDENSLSARSGVTFIPKDKIQLGRQLGKGSFGTVYEGTWKYRSVAVKCYEGTRLPERAAAEVRHEVSIMLRLDHECLVRFFGLVQEDSHPAMLVMEYGAGGSLYDYLHSHQDIPWQVRLRLASELARGLAYLHEEKIVHRDIKSLNIVLDRDLHAKWCDFGLAVLKLHSTTTSKADAQVNSAGTLPWMAPELFSRKSSTPSTASDMWALGMVFFELSSRQIPYKDARNEEILKDWIKSGEKEEVPKECEEQSPGFAKLMQDCWQERTARPTAEQVVNVTSALCAGYAEPNATKKAATSVFNSDYRWNSKA